MFLQSPYCVPRLPLVRTVLLLFCLVILFVTLHPVFDATRLLWNVSLPRPPLHSSPFVSPHLKQQSGHRIKVQRPPVEPAHDEPWAQRADAVRGAFLHAYEAYLTHASPHDELLPLTNSSIDKCVCSPPRTADRSLWLTLPCVASTAGVLQSSILLTRCGSWACTTSLTPHSPS